MHTTDHPLLCVLSLFALKHTIFKSFFVNNVKVNLKATRI